MSAVVFTLPRGDAFQTQTCLKARIESQTDNKKTDNDQNPVLHSGFFCQYRLLFKIRLERSVLLRCLHCAVCHLFCSVDVVYFITCIDSWLLRKTALYSNHCNIGGEEKRGEEKRGGVKESELVCSKPQMGVLGPAPFYTCSGAVQ